MAPNVEKHVALGDRYWEDGCKLLDQEDWPQASEKLWGAAAQMVKAVAEQRGWEHDGHALLFKQVGKLAKDLENPDLRKLFGLAHNLHVNFYDDYLTPEMVSDGAEAVRQFREYLRKLLP